MRLVGSRPTSSQNRLTPSANILSSSTESYDVCEQREEGGGCNGRGSGGGVCSVGAV